MKKFFTAAFLATTLTNAQVIDEVGLFNDNVKQLVDNISTELFDKTGVRLNLVSQPELREPNLEGISLVFVPNSVSEGKERHGKVKIFASKELFRLFDAEAVMSPYPHKGSILPILANPKASDIYNAAAINGFADIAERVAKSKNVVLQSSIGNANKSTLNTVRFGAYGFLAGVILLLISRQIYRKKAK